MISTNRIHTRRCLAAAIFWLTVSVCSVAGAQEVEDRPQTFNAPKDSVTSAVRMTDNPGLPPAKVDARNYISPERDADTSARLSSFEYTLPYNPATGLLFRDNGFSIYGYGRQLNIPGVGKINEAYLKYRYSFRPGMLVGLGMYANKVCARRSSSETFALDADITCRLNSSLSATAFGSYYRINDTSQNHTLMMNGYHCGGFLSWGITPKWTMDMGVRTYGNSKDTRSVMAPILQTSYKDKGREINADFSGIFQQLLLGVFSNK